MGHIARGAGGPCRRGRGGATGCVTLLFVNRSPAGCAHSKGPTTPAAPPLPRRHPPGYTAVDYTSEPLAAAPTTGSACLAFASERFGGSAVLEVGKALLGPGLDAFLEVLGLARPVLLGQLALGG